MKSFNESDQVWALMPGTWSMQVFPEFKRVRACLNIKVSYLLEDLAHPGCLLMYVANLSIISLLL